MSVKRERILIVMSRSVIYTHLWFYRGVMSLLYHGQYGARFKRVAAGIRNADKIVLELCFGDVMIAEYCRQQGKAWIGMDVNEAFVAYAVKRGFDARRADLSEAMVLPACDVLVMMGSLYHFRTQLPELFLRMKAASGRLILSEPVKNWTHSNRLLRFLARKGTRVGTKDETFRFDESSLLEALNELKASVGFDYHVVSVTRDMIVEVVWLS